MSGLPRDEARRLADLTLGAKVTYAAERQLARALDASLAREEAERERRERAEAALVFYADERRYEYDETCSAVGWQTYDGDDVLQDGGAIARAALSAREPGK